MKVMPHPLVWICDKTPTKKGGGGEQERERERASPKSTGGKHEESEEPRPGSPSVILSGRGVTKLLTLTPLGRYPAWLPYPHILKCSVSLVIEISCLPSVAQASHQPLSFSFLMCIIRL